ncbi:Serine protease gd [Eumeta japonica]|uniref:Serine protease gd n=1 Tax=Eumeta variegata TaxID=151549 RepID=A0A4C1W5M1_EUMVA|nr:Serine protease gd [Eumeta japonica]
MNAPHGRNAIAYLRSNWDAEVSTKDNIDFKIENPDLRINATPVKSLRLFAKYDILQGPPKIVSIRLNGREICDTDDPLPTAAKQEAATERYTPPPPPPAAPPTSRTQPYYPPAPEPYYPSAPEPLQRYQNRPETKKNLNLVTVVLPQEELRRLFESIGSSRPVAEPYPLSTGNDQAFPSVISETYRRGFAHRLFPPLPRFSKTITMQYLYKNLAHLMRGYRSEVSNDRDYHRNKYDVRGTYNQENNNDDRYFQCGKVYRSHGDNPNPLVVRGAPTLAGQWPWQVALYKTERLQNNYHCGGTLVSKLHVITAAHCVTHKGSNVALDKYTLTLYLGKHNLRVTEDGAQVRLVSEIFVHDDYDSNFFSKDVAILKLREAVQLSQWIQPACLWPEDRTDLSHILGKKGSVVGWGYNEIDQLNEELSLVEMPVVDELTCIRSKRKFFAIFTSESTYCAGDRSGSSVCNGDSGGGMVFKMQGSWYLRGLVSLSVPREDRPSVCDPRHYIIFTDLAKFLPWIKGIVNKDNYN